MWMKDGRRYERITQFDEDQAALLQTLGGDPGERTEMTICVEDDEGQIVHVRECPIICWRGSDRVIGPGGLMIAYWEGMERTMH